MPRLRCPRCASVVEVAPGAAPLCTSCGFGSQPPAPVAAAPLPPIPADAVLAAPMAMPPRPSPPPPPAPPAPAPPSRRGAVVAIVVVGVLVLAGAAAAVAFFALRGEAPQELTEAEAQARVQASLQAASDALVGESSDGELRKVTAEADPPESAAPSGPDDLFGGFGQMRMTVDYGRDDVVRFDLHMSSGAVTVAFTLYCTPERQYMVAGGEAYASRPSVAAEGEPCSEFRDGFTMGEEGAEEDGPLPLGGLEASQADITRNKDGSLHAEFDEEGDHVAVDLDPQGRLQAVTVVSPEEGTWSMAYEYGDRQAISPPEDFTLLPASVALEEDSQGGRHTWSVMDSPEEPPLVDFEVRVQDYASSFDFDGDGGSPEPAILATFGLTAAPQSDGNLTFRFTDADGDGKLTAGDSFEIVDGTTAADEASSFSYFPYQVVLYDRVAEGEVNSGFNEMPSPAWLALAALALAGLASRRR
jgi:MYXO-CTERM domain-containing protein